MKYIRIFALIAFCLPALGLAIEEDPSLYLTALKEGQIEEKILESEVFKSCQAEIASAGDLTTDAGKEKVRECLQNKLSDVSEEQLNDFSNAIELDVAFKENKNSKSLREYLSKRIYNAIHGPNAYENKELKNRKFVDHALYLELYKSQLSKNLILDVSRYCLENVGIKGEPGTVITAAGADAQSQSQTKKGQVSTDVAFKRMIKGETNASITIRHQKLAQISDPKNMQGIDGLPSPQVETLDASNAVNFWSKIEEYRYCPKLNQSNKSDPCYKERARNQKQIEFLKDRELAWADANSDNISAKYNACSNTLIKNMCELYRCNNVYNENSTSILHKEPAKKVCPLYGVNTPGGTNSSLSPKVESLDVDVDKNRGQIACNLMKRIERYKTTFAAIEEAEKKNQELRGAATGVATNVFFDKGNYDRKNIDDLTSISSKELVQKVSAFGETQKTGEQLKEKCFSEDGQFNSADPECASLGGEIDGEDLAKIQLDTEAETAIYLERLKKINTGDKEELKEYLIKHGLHDYLSSLEDGSIDPDKLVELISDKYKADRKTLINNMKERFYALTKKKKESKNADDSLATNADLANVAEARVEEIEQQKDRLETLYNYSNIVSSYLQAKDKDDKTTENTRARQIELEGINKFGEDAEKQTYEQYFSQTEESKDSASDASISAQGEFIDNILGIGATE